MADGVKTPTGRGSAPPPARDVATTQERRFVSEDVIGTAPAVSGDQVVKDNRREAGRIASPDQVFRVLPHFSQRSEVSEGDLRRLDVVLSLWGLISESKFDPNSGGSGSESGD